MYTTSPVANWSLLDFGLDEVFKSLSLEVGLGYWLTRETIGEGM